MTAPFRGSFITDDDIRRELTTRRRTVVFQTARAANEGALVTLIESKATEGWRISKRNRASVRLEKDKPSGERLEDEVWSIIARLGFYNISSGRDFQVLMNGTYRQVDVVAADDESAIFIECTQSDVPKKKSMTQLIDKVTSFQQVPLRDRCSFGRFPWLISQALSVTYMAGERRLYLERNCRLPESPAHSRRRNREGPASSKGLNRRVRPSGRTSAKVEAALHESSWFVAL